MKISKISTTSLKSYIDEKLTLMEKDIKRMRQAFNEDNAPMLVDNFGGLQYHEMAIIFAAKGLMEQNHFSEKDLMMQPIKEYQESKEN